MKIYLFFTIFFVGTCLNVFSQSDRSPHKSEFADVNGVKLHYLDWGGKGKTLVLLAGLGNSAHIFDDLAPKFTDRFRVLGLTRRGHGKSSSPDKGYDLPTLAEDILKFLDHMHVKRASLVGHSFAGDEITYFATHYPERVDKIVYLDAAYTRADLAGESFSKNPFPTPPITKEERSSVEGYRRWYERTRGFWTDAVENDLRETSIGPDGALKSAFALEVGQGIMKTVSDFPPDYSKIRAATLAFYVVPEVTKWVPQDAESKAKAEAYLDRANRPYLRNNIQKLKKELPKVKIVLVEKSHHYLFIKNQAEVVQSMRKFLK